MEGHQVGLVRMDFVDLLKKYPEVFEIKSNSVVLNPAFRDYNERTKKVESVLMECRQNNSFTALNGWRDEVSISCNILRSYFSVTERSYVKV